MSGNFSGLGSRFRSFLPFWLFLSFPLEEAAVAEAVSFPSTDRSPIAKPVVLSAYSSCHPKKGLRSAAKSFFVF